MHAGRCRWISGLVLSAFLCVHPRPLLADDALAAELKRLLDVYTLVDREGAEPIDSKTAIYQGAIPGMLRTLDPHSIFFDPDQFSQLQELQTSERKGFGTVVSLLPGRVIILQALEGTPAARAGLSGGDEIVSINGYQVAYFDVEQLQQLLGQSRQREAVLEVRKPGSERIDRLTLSPQMLDQPTVDRAFHLEPGIGYLRITGFEEPTGFLVRETIEKLGGEFLKGLVIDLRDNPGGVVPAALDTAALFLSPQQLVFSSKGRHAEAEDIYVAKDSVPYTFPVVVLMNSKSASASEIVAGALQDHDRAVILGEASFGKGLVQRVIPLSGGTGLALTTAFYYTPSGRNIQKPLHGGQLDATTGRQSGLYMSDSGRALRGGGGIEPDQAVLPAALSRLQQVMDASGSLTSFASEYLRSGPLPAPLEITPQMLAELREFLLARRIEPTTAEWNGVRTWIVSRLTQEFVNLTEGVAKGDEMELRRDAVVQAALKKLRGEQ